MVFAEGLPANFEGAFVELSCLIVLALFVQQQGEVVERDSDVGMVFAEGLLENF